MAKKEIEYPKENLAAFKNALRSKEFHSLYVFCGEESYLREYYLKQLTKSLSGPADDFNFHRFSTENISVQEFSNAIEAMPMMADKTFVRVDDVDFFSFDEEERTQYAQILSDIPDYCCVVLHYDAIPFKVDGKLRKLAAVFSKNAVVLEYRKQTERELTAWVCRHFKAGGKEISDKLCRYLIFITDGIMTTLSSEIEKIISYSSGTNISQEDIDAVVTPALNATSFEISDAIIGGNYDLALSKLQTLFAMQEEPPKILGAISAQFRRIQYAKIITSCGKGQETLERLTGFKDFAGKTMTAARRVSDRFCKTAMELCMNADIKIKSSFGDEQQILELLLAELAVEVRRD